MIGLIIEFDDRLKIMQEKCPGNENLKNMKEKFIFMRLSAELKNNGDEGQQLQATLDWLFELRPKCDPKQCCLVIYILINEICG